MMKDIKDFVRETISESQVDESDISMAREAWKELCTPKVDKVIEKEWPALPEHFEILYPAAKKKHLTDDPKVVAMYLIDYIDNEMIEDFEQMTLRQALDDLKVYLSALDASYFEVTLDEYIDNM